MFDRNALNLLLMSTALVAGLLWFASVANTLPAAPVTLKPDQNAKSYVVKIKRRRKRRVRIRLPRGPAYIYHDYPYYYARGFYPKHIGGYIYYPHVPIYYRTYRDRCAKQGRRCAVKRLKKRGSKFRRRKRR